MCIQRVHTTSSFSIVWSSCGRQCLLGYSNGLSAMVQQHRVDAGEQLRIVGASLRNRGGAVRRCRAKTVRELTREAIVWHPWLGPLMGGEALAGPAVRPPVDTIFELMQKAFCEFKTYLSIFVISFVISIFILKRVSIGNKSVSLANHTRSVYSTSSANVRSVWSTAKTMEMIDRRLSSLSFVCVWVTN